MEADGASSVLLVTGMSAWSWSMRDTANAALMLVRDGSLYTPAPRKVVMLLPGITDMTPRPAPRVSESVSDCGLSQDSTSLSLVKAELSKANCSPSCSTVHAAPTVKFVVRLSSVSGTSSAWLKPQEAPHGWLPLRL